jgi:hypothetical protein
MRGASWVLAAAVASTACTTVKVTQRDGCWVKVTKRTFGGAREELGPCAKAEPPWAQDRVTRLVQECAARADHRWQSRAVVAWTEGAPLPAREEDEQVLRACMDEAAAAGLLDRQVLERRLADVNAELAEERKAARAREEAERTQLARVNERLAEHLGEAARRPLPPATATATASSEGRTRSEAPAGAPATVAVLPVVGAGQGAEAAAPAGGEKPVVKPAVKKVAAKAPGAPPAAGACPVPPEDPRPR